MKDLKKQIIDEIDKVKKEYSEELSNLVKERKLILKKYKKFLKDKK